MVKALVYTPDEVQVQKKINHWHSRRSRAVFFQGMTVKIIPPSGTRIIDFSISPILLVFLGLVLGGILASVIFMATRLDHNGANARLVSDRLSTTQGNLDSVTDEIHNLLQTYDVFNAALASTIRELAVSGSAGAGTTGMVGTEPVRNLQELSASLGTAIKPLQETVSVMRTQKEILSDIPNVWPVQGGGMLSMEFGPNVHPVRGVWYMHKGIDISDSSGLPVVASANGRVLEVKYDEASGYGRTVLVEHKYGFMTRYAHLGAWYVKEGDEVVQGQKLGTLGSSGLSTGPHTHFEVLLGNQVLDPVSFLKISNNFKRWTGDRPITWE